MLIQYDIATARHDVNEDLFFESQAEPGLSTKRSGQSPKGGFKNCPRQRTRGITVA